MLRRLPGGRGADRPLSAARPRRLARATATASAATRSSRRSRPSGRRSPSAGTSTRAGARESRDRPDADRQPRPRRHLVRGLNGRRARPAGGTHRPRRRRRHQPSHGVQSTPIGDVLIGPRGRCRAVHTQTISPKRRFSKRGDPQTRCGQLRPPSRRPGPCSVQRVDAAKPLQCPPARPRRPSDPRGLVRGVPHLVRGPTQVSHLVPGGQHALRDRRPGRGPPPRGSGSARPGPGGDASAEACLRDRRSPPPRAPPGRAADRDRLARGQLQRLDRAAQKRSTCFATARARAM